MRLAMNSWSFSLYFPSIIRCVLPCLAICCLFWDRSHHVVLAGLNSQRSTYFSLLRARTKGMRYQCWVLGSLVKQLKLDMSVTCYVTLIPLLPPEDWNDSSVLPHVAWGLCMKQALTETEGLQTRHSQQSRPTAQFWGCSLGHTLARAHAELWWCRAPGLCGSR